MTTTVFSPAFIPLVNRLRRLKKSGSGYTAACPSHEDNQNSLSVTEAASKNTPGARLLLLKCFASCSLEDICHSLGCEKKDLFTKDPGSTRVPSYPNRPKQADTSPSKRTEYEIRSESGVLQAIHIRQDMSNGRKSFWWRLPGATENGLHGLPVSHLPLYGVHRLAEFEGEEWRKL